MCGFFGAVSMYGFLDAINGNDVMTNIETKHNFEKKKLGNVFLKDVFHIYQLQCVMLR